MTTTEIKEYLENYTAKKAIAEYKKKQGLTEDRTLVCITAIEDCIAGLPNGLDYPQVLSAKDVIARDEQAVLLGARCNRQKKR